MPGRKPAAEHPRESNQPGKHSPLTALGRWGNHSARHLGADVHSTIRPPHPLLSLPWFAPSQKGPSLGLQMKQSQHLVKSVLLLLENIHARQCTL